MNEARFLHFLDEAFSGVTLGAARTLLDEDYTDCGRQYLECDPYRSKEERLAQLPRDWSALSQQLYREAVLTGQRVKEPFSGWRDIPLSYLDDHQAGAYFYAPQAFRFYIPAFMRHYVLAGREWNQSGSMAPTIFMDSLCPPADDPSTTPGLRRILLERLSVLSRAQAKAINLFLMHVSRRDDDIDLAYQAYTARQDFWLPLPLRLPHNRSNAS